MPRRVLRLILVGMLFSTFMGVIAISAGPVKGAPSSGSSTAGVKVFSDIGTHGSFAFQEPPGSLPVSCVYSSDPSGFDTINAEAPSVFPSSGLTSQLVSITLTINQRRPDGSIVPSGSAAFFEGVVTDAAPNLRATIPRDRDLGSTFVVTAHIGWLNAGVEQGSVDLLYTHYQTTIPGTPSQTLPVMDACYPARPAIAQLQFNQGIVGSSIGFRIFRFPQDPNVGVFFDGTKIGSVATDEHGIGSGSFIVPAAPLGPHTVRFFRFGRNATATFTIKPRIKVIPSSNLTRGQTVNVSLRGYAAHETVRIRWKNGSTFQQITQVTTSSTGSANVSIRVPSFAAIGTNSVRGDGSVGHAQTNAVTVVATSSQSAGAQLSPTPTKTPTSKPTATQAPPSPTITQAPETVAAPVQPTEMATTPLEETPTQVATPVPTEIATETPTATATDSPTSTVAPEEETAVTGG